MSGSAFRWLSVAASAVLLAAAAPVPVSLDWLMGDWQGSGTVHGQPSTATLAVGPALGGRFVELRYRFTTGGTRPFAFEGRGFYTPAAQGWAGQWFDSTGATRPLRATAGDRELLSEWGDAASERGHSRYRLSPDGSLEVVDEVLRKAGWAEFARHRFTRKP